ncbi:MAG: hypothetical protein PHE47_06955 [Oscillospiraceae bacterium]|nr:hypothetical protein [Oscillospiraceae bacterium]
MEKIERCKTSALILKVSLLLQVLYVLAEGMILAAQRPLKKLLNAGLPETLQQNLYPVMDILLIVLVLVLHVALFALLWSQGENASSRVAEVLAIIIGGLILTGLPISLTALSDMGYAVQGAQTLANYSLLSSVMGMARPLSRLGLVLLIVGATASLGNKRSCPVLR